LLSQLAPNFIHKETNLKDIISPATETKREMDSKGSSQSLCAVCGLKIVEGNSISCPIHSKAYQSLKRAYSVWDTAYGSMTVAEFLKRITILPETGSNAKELAAFFVKNPAGWK